MGSEKMESPGVCSRVFTVFLMKKDKEGARNFGV